MDIFIGRQPIFDRNLKVVGYELLYRNGNVSSYNCDDGDRATENLLYNVSSMGLRLLCCNKSAFINFTQKTLVNKLPRLLDKDYLIVEILEDVDLNESVIESCKMMRKEGYRFAVDDYVYERDIMPIIDYIDIIKVDFLQNDYLNRKRIIDKYKKKHKKILAEKIETRDDLKQALELGYDYFQGYFFCRPDTLKGHDVYLNEVKIIELFSELYKEEVNFDRIEKLIRYDAGMVYKLLKYVNSSYFGFAQEISSVRQAISLLGKEEMKKWVTFVGLGGDGKGSEDDERAKLGMIRGKFCENLCASIEPSQMESAFLVGIFSTIDVLLGVEMKDVIHDLPLEKDIKEALLGTNNFLGTILNVVLQYEKMQDYTSEYNKLITYNSSITEKTEEDIAEMFLKSLQWTQNIF
ncbi:EAL and HDOD domain-containing protein [Inconstantimicrobium porci]|uniref:HDOD domain-containing protein n=1 Tax=Inconstantimicrobium porci TaxID=2652291 RepID=A0A7X2MVQ8_9CLOT|nr:HDOD domain-containing protein [Inconstantimicrobium porci]MSR89944.1 HDOD domain-containing protein [Inconstantimicrobium porci]